MTTSATPTPYEHLELRDGIFFYRKLSRRGGALVLAAPKYCVEVVHRAEHRRLGNQYDASMFFIIVFVLPWIAMGFLDASTPEVLRSSGLAILVVSFLVANVVRRPLANGQCQTELAVITDRGKHRLMFTRVQGEDAAFEEILDRLQRGESDRGTVSATGCVVEIARSWGSVFKYLAYAMGALLLLAGSIVEIQRLPQPMTAYLVTAGVIACGLIITLAIDPWPPASARKARGALLENDFATASSLLYRILEKNPHHAYANYLMTAHALSTGDFDAAAHHRAAMNGLTNRERLSVIAIDFAHTISSEPAFRRLTAYAHGEGVARTETLSQVTP